MAFLTDFPKEKKIMNRKNIVPRRNLILYKTLEYLEDRETKQKNYLGKNMDIIVTWLNIDYNIAYTY